MSTEATALHDWYRGFIRGKTRIGMAWAFSIVLILSARQYPTLPGILICFLGATLRFWASGYLAKDDKLSVGGPYGMTRNPLYVGTWLMGAGTAIAIENWWLTGIFAPGYFVVYHYIILDEESKLRGIFGPPFDLYLKTVPRFFPRPWPVSIEKRKTINENPDRFHFSWTLAMKHKAYEAYAAFAALIGLTAALAWAWQNFGSFAN